MRTIITALAMVSLLVLPCGTVLGAKDEIKRAENQTKMPEPLEAVYGNLTDLEKSGHFKLLGARLARTKPLDQEAMIWTVRVLRPITYRHAMQIFRLMGDVRFYRTTDYGRQELYWTELYYSFWISDGATQGGLLDPGEEFEIWVLMDATKIQLLDHRSADTVVFSQLKRYGDPKLYRVGKKKVKRTSEE